MSLASGCPCNVLVSTKRGRQDHCGLCLITLQVPSGWYLSTFVLKNKVLKVAFLKFTLFQSQWDLMLLTHPKGRSETAYQNNPAAWCNEWGSMAGAHPASCHPKHVDCSFAGSRRWKKKGKKKCFGCNSLQQILSYIGLSWHFLQNWVKEVEIRHTTPGRKTVVQIRIISCNDANIITRLSSSQLFHCQSLRDGLFTPQVGFASTSVSFLSSRDLGIKKDQESLTWYKV